MLARALRVIFLLVFAGYVISLGSVYFGYIEPYIFPLRFIQGDARYLTENIIIGPYPHKKDFEKLINVNKVTVIISLLNPSLPFEKSLLNREKETLSEFKVRFYNVPLSFLRMNSQENYRAVAKVKEIIEKHRGEKIYIHCYLGRHRVGFLADKLLGTIR